MSGLPSGYTQLEYIQSSGTQYIDTGIKGTSTMRVKVEFMVLGFGPGTTFVFGAQTPEAARYTLGFTSGGVFRSDFGSQMSSGDTAQLNTWYDADKNGNVCTIGSGKITNNSATFIGTSNIYLFARSYTSLSYSKIRMRSCKIYNGSTLVRDFIPCKNASGAVGLYDTVEGQFYANAGMGTFTAGPEIIYEPATPTNFTASVSGQTVALSWAAAANAAGYRLKRDGVQIAEQTGTTYTDTVPDGTTLCTYALTAYNDAVESAAVTLLVLVQLELITDRTRADVANQTDKGFYNASDLNRVGAAVEYIAGRFTALGYACPVTVKKDWLTSDAPTASQMETYRQNIVTLRGQIAVMASTPEAPASMAGLNYVKANNIEQILLDLDALIDKLIKSWCFSGELYAGEV